MTATPGRWIASAVVAAAASFAAVGVARSWGPGVPPADLARYPEVASADPDLVRTCWSALRRGRTALDVVGPKDREEPRGRRRDKEDFEQAEEALSRAFRDVPVSATGALLRVLCSWRFQPSFDLTVDAGMDDEPRQWLAVQLRDHADGAGLRVLGRIASDPTLAWQARRLAVDAIARPDDPVAAEVLEALALDRGLDVEVRRLAVTALPRLHARPSPRIHALLDEPFGRLDEATAVALLRSGDAEAPSLVVDALRELATQYWSARWSDAICATLRPLVAGDPAMEAGLSGVRTTADALRAADTIDAWIAAHPERFDTEFERARRESLATPLPSVSLNDIACSDADFDLGTALIVTDDSERDPARSLERLDRLVRAVRRDAGPAPTPERWIEAMNEHLLRGPCDPGWPVRDSELGYVLRTGHGNCMGMSSLYLAVAERLGLPIHGVAAPHHVFARWDDGKFRRNVECTARGAELQDTEYDGREGCRLAAVDAESGAYLANITKRQLLALALVNRWDRLREAGDLPAGAWAIDCALRLDPRCVNALVTRANLRSRSPNPEDRAAGLGDARAAESIRNLTPSEADFAANAYFAAGLPEDALRLTDAVGKVDPDSALVHALRGKALMRLGRRNEACASAREAIERAGHDAGPLVDAAEVLAAAADPAWSDVLATPRLHATVVFHANVELATRLLDGSPWHPPVPSAASVALATAEARLARASAAEDWAVLEERPRVLRLRARCCRALGDEDGAAAAAAELAKIESR